MKYLEENDDEQQTIADLTRMMGKFLKDSNNEPYSEVHMKRKVVDYFGDHILITNVNGLPNVVTLKHTASSLLYDFYAQKKGRAP